MNLLVVGTDKSDILGHLPDTFLFIDDGAMIDAIPFPERRKITYLDLSRHSYNPLKDIDYRRARELVQIFDAIFPEGESTLTKKSSNFALLSALLANPSRFDKLIGQGSEPGVLDAYQKVQTLLLSPVLNRFLCNPTNFSFDGILIARLDRTILSDFDCFVIGNLLISRYQGHVVIPDFGFYSCPFHISLIRQERLIAGLNFLDEVPALKSRLLLIEQKIAKRCTADDAETIAAYSGLVKGTNAHTDFVQRAVSGGFS